MASSTVMKPIITSAYGPYSRAARVICSDSVTRRDQYACSTNRFCACVHPRYVESPTPASVSSEGATAVRSSGPNGWSRHW